MATPCLLEVAIPCACVAHEFFSVLRRSCVPQGVFAALPVDSSCTGTDNHLVLMNLRPKGITGSKVEKMCDRVHITVNKNSVVGDKSAVTPGGVRLGAPAMTTRGLKENDFKQIATFLHRGIEESVLPAHQMLVNHSSSCFCCCGSGFGGWFGLDDGGG